MAGGTAAPFIKVGIAIAATAASFALAASQKTTTTGPRLGDLSVSAATYGLPIPRGWGTVRMGGNMIWTSGIKEKSTTTHRGKGGMGGKTSATNYTYSASFAFAFSKGPCARILRIWADSKIVYDETSSGNVAVPGLVLRQYYGTEDQLPDPSIVADKGDGQVPGFRGLVYIVAEDVPLEPFGNRIPNISAEIAFTGEGHSSLYYMTNPIPKDNWPPQYLYDGFPFSIQAPDNTIDFSRRIWYMSVTYLSTTDQNGGLMTATLDPFQVYRMQPMADMYAGTFYNGGDGIVPSGSSSYIVMTVAGNGTDLFVDIGNKGTNRGYFVRVNPETLKVTGQYGSNIDTFMGGWDPSTADAVCNPTNAVINFIVSETGTVEPLVAFSNWVNGPQIFNGTTMDHVWGSVKASLGGPFEPTYITPRLAPAPLHYSGGNSHIIPGRRNDDGTCEFWWIQFSAFLADNSPIDPVIDVWRIEMPTLAEFELAFTLPVTAFIPGATDVFIGRCEYDVAGDNIIMIFDETNDFDQNHIVSINRFGGVNWHNPNISYNSFGPQQSGHSYLVGNTFAWSLGPVWVIDTTTGNLLENDVPEPHDSEIFWAAYNAPEMAIYQIGIFGGTAPGYGPDQYTQVEKILVNRGSGGSVALSNIVSDISQEAGLTVDQIDVSSLSDNVLGYSRIQETARNLLGDLCQVYMFDFVETDYRLTAKKRGSDPIAAIAYANLLPQGTSAAALPMQRNQAESLPRRFWVRYSDINNDQQQGTQHWSRAEAPPNASVINSAGEITLDLRIVMNADTAKTLAKKRLMIIWQERETFQQTSLPPAYLALDPADVVTLQGRDGVGYRVRLEKVSLGADLSIAIQGTVEDPNLLNVTAHGFGGTGITPTMIPTPYTPIGIQPEMPLLRDGDDTGGTGLREYAAIGAYAGQTFAGATMYVSPDSVSWAGLFGSTQSMIWGVTTNALPAPATVYCTDTANFIDVTMTFGGDKLESATAAQVLEGANPAILITADGSTELLQFETVTPLGGTGYRLGNLLRGRKGSEWTVDKHTTGETFVLLETTGWGAAALPLAYFNTTRYEKTVGLTDIFDAVAAIPRKFLGTAEKPYAPVWITSIRDMVSNDLTVTWQRRTRIGGEWIDGTETIPLGESSEAYDIDILAGDGSTIRTLHATTQSVVYTGTDQTTDGLDADPVPVAVYQKSETVGRGYPGFATLPSSTGDTGAPSVTLDDIGLSATTVPAGVSAPKTVGTVSVSTTGGPFTGTISLAGPDAAKFAVAGNVLRTAAPLPARDHYITMVAAQTGATGSPLGVPATISATSTGAPSLSSISLSATSFVSGSSGLTVGTISVAMSSGSFSGTLALSGTDASSFVLTGNTLTTASALTPRNYSIVITATQTGATGSPLATTFSLTATTTLNSISLSSTSVVSGSSGATVGAITVGTTGSFTGSLSITGTDAAKFAISGSNLNTAIALSVGTYSISLRATQSGATGSPLTRAFTITAASGGAITAPSQATAAGYSTLVFSDDFDATGTISTAQNDVSGFNWYWAQRLGLPASPSEWTVSTSATAASISNGNTSGGANASPNGGILTLHDGAFPNANLISLPGWAMNSSLTTLPALGTGRWQRCYVEAYIQFRPDQNTSAIYTSNGWPAFWGWAAEGIGDYGFPGSGLTTSNTTEVDFLESFGNVTWTGGGSGPANTNQATIINHTSNVENVFASISPIDSEWHTFGFLWTTGHIALYFDNTLRGSLTLSPNYTALDSQSLFLTLGTGPSWVMNIDWVRVWQ